MVKAFVAAKIGSQEYLGTAKHVKEQIAKIPGTLKVEIVLGSYDIIAEVEAKNLDEISRMVTDKIKSIPSIATTETFVCSEE
jgi:DNA-binding Lrp family transcriptional regulator